MIVGGRIILINPNEALVRTLTARDFRIVEDDRTQSLGLRIIALDTPRRLSTAAALRFAQSSVPNLTADFDHLYKPAGAALGPSRALPARPGGRGTRLIGMIDGGVGGHPAVDGTVKAQRGFAGPVRASAHGTAIASLLVGRNARFRGAAPGEAALLVADVYGGKTLGGSATAIAKALDWLVASGARVANISLVGPRNALLERAIDAAGAKGTTIVAAVGNDGPAAPPRYPASYPGVVSVTGVDARGNPLFEAGQAAHLDFAAPGADMAAATIGGGYTRVRGTSFASALVAGRLAIAGSIGRLALEARPGRGRVGRGIVCATCRVDPASVGAK
jgi:hypothetical protein